jgi:hypothetical protein
MLFLLAAANISPLTTPGHCFAQGAAVSVGGPAGHEVDVWFDQTYWAKNRSSRKVIVKLGSTWSVLLNPGQTWKFTYQGQNIVSFMGTPSAFYQ